MAIKGNESGKIEDGGWLRMAMVLHHALELMRKYGPKEKIAGPLINLKPAIFTGSQDGRGGASNQICQKEQRHTGKWSVGIGMGTAISDSRQLGYESIRETFSVSFTTDSLCRDLAHVHPSAWQSPTVEIRHFTHKKQEMVAIEDHPGNLVPGCCIAIILSEQVINSPKRGISVMTSDVGCKFAQQHVAFTVVGIRGESQTGLGDPLKLLYPQEPDERSGYAERTHEN